MPTKAQFNPSTLKASYNASTQKQQAETYDCHSSGIYTVSFSDVSHCSGMGAWPSDINNITDLACSWDPVDELWEGTSGGWTIQLQCAGGILEIGAYCDCAENEEGCGAFYDSQTDIESGTFYNDFDVGDCGTGWGALTINGYAGECSYSWSSS